VDTVVRTTTFTSDLEEMVSRCRSLQGRMCWPGAVPSWETHETLYYQVSMRLKSATMTDIDIEERLTPLETTGDGVLFRTAQRCTWPDGVADAETEYRFSSGSPNNLQLTYSYAAPSTKLVRTKDLKAFHAGMERVVSVYLDALTGMTVSGERR
jgi:hypothetical protein